MLKGKCFSILGDSISTYRGVSNNPSVNSTLFANPYFYSKRFPLKKTYWYRLIKDLGLNLCVNNSWSGGNLSGKENPSSGMNRAHHLSDNDGTTPDMIIIFMGINDLGRGINIEVFSEDYEKTLITVKRMYPLAAVCCVNIPDRDESIKERTKRFNLAIENAVKKAGDKFFVADLFNIRLNNDFYYNNTLDGLHPDEDGMRIISEVIKDAILRNVGGSLSC